MLRCMSMRRLCRNVYTTTERRAVSMSPDVLQTEVSLKPYSYVHLARSRVDAMQDDNFELKDISSHQNNGLRVINGDKEHEAAADTNDLVEEQRRLESKCIDEAIQYYRSLAETLRKKGKAADLKPFERLLVSWFAPLTAAIEEERKSLKESSSKHAKLYAEQIAVLTAEQLACITLHEMVNMLMLGQRGVPYTRAARALGKAVEFQVNITSIMEDKVLGSGMEFLMRKADGRHWKTARLARKVQGRLWTDAELIQVGALLLDRLIASAMVFDPREGEVPALTTDIVAPHKLFLGNRKPQRTVLCSEKVLQILASRVADTGPLFVVSKPMLCMPQPWTQPDVGGYLTYKTQLVRTRSSRHQQLLQKADLSKIYHALNFLGSIPWKINSRMLDVVEELWKRGGDVAGLVKNGELKKPVEDPDLPKSEYDAAVKFWEKKSKELFALRCDTNLKLNCAREFKGRPIYFPCNLDFRGRVYPLPPHLNHLGADLARSLLMFEEGRPLGDNGLKWLKVHLANMSGRDKLSFELREQWVNDNLQNVIEVYEDPFGERSEAGLWWQSFEAPLQALATIFELREALEDPYDYISHLPIHMDGSCNGLQHYGALGRDKDGGAAVNLYPNEVPQDVYAGVLQIVNKKIEADAKKGHEYAVLLDGKVNRKVIKQTVMTSVYGVTLMGAKAQVLARLEELPTIEWPSEKTDEVKRKAALYVAKLALSSLGDLFSSARQIMAWLGTVAHMVAAQQQPVTWLTPLGLPVLQPYSRENEYQVQTMNFRLTIANHGDLMPPSLSKQKTAFPPNFVHSLDATHMLMTTIDCQDRGLQFAAVHDSFWTHAGSVDDMNLSLREQFVNLYSEPVLENFRESLSMRFPNVTFPAIPQRGELDIRKVLKSKYFFA